MPPSQVSCPNCRQPVVADIERLFDINVDPGAKQKLLSGAANFLQCPHCGFQGSLATPIVYHDPEKELLLTFVPPELGLPRDEQERLVGGLINQVVNNLPQEARKGYLLRPQSTLTMQGLVERILEEDGITKEMIEAQQQRISLIQRLLTASPESRPEIIEQESELLDADFFALLNRLLEASSMGGDERSSEQLVELQRELLASTAYGQELQAQSAEVEAAVAELQQIGRNLTREKLVELVANAPNETRVQAYVSLARPAMDYQFFQLLSERIERARGDGRKRLIERRDMLLEITQAIDAQVEQRRAAARKLIERILAADNIEQALGQSSLVVDEFFITELSAALDAARKAGDLEKSSKLQQIVNMIEEASKPPDEVQFIEELLEIEDDAAREAMLSENKDKITPDLISMLTNLTGQVGESEDQELVKRVNKLHRQVLRYSMRANLSS